MKIRNKMGYTLQQTTLLYCMTTSFFIGMVVSGLGYMPSYQIKSLCINSNTILATGMAGIVIGNVIKDQLQ